jgi:hypothetical protein
MARRAARVLIALALTLGAAPAAAQLRAVEVPIGGRAGIDSLSRLGFEVAAVRVVDGALRAVVVTDVAAERALLASGYAPAAALPAPAAADTFRSFRSFDRPGVGIRATLAAWAAADTVIHVDSIGATLEGRPILAVKIGRGSDSPARPNVLFLGTHHAREWVATEMAMKLIRWIADSLPRPLLAERDIWVIPVENPDGYQFTFTGDRLWRKNRRPNGDGTFGVDLNRNYPGFWGIDDAGSSPVPGSEVYRGPAPASEVETQAIIAFHAAHPPVLAVSYHTFSGLVLHPYGHRSGAVAPEAAVFRALAGTDLEPAVRDSVPGSTLAYYHPGPGWHLYPTNGEYTDWAYRAHGTIAHTPELTSGCCVPGTGQYYGFVFPDDSALVERVFRDNLPFARSVIVAAGDPLAATGASGLAPGPERFEALWPEVRVSRSAAAGGSQQITVRAPGGGTVTRTLAADSLDRGPYRATWRVAVTGDDVRAVRVDGTGLAAELLTLGGAEPADTGWRGWGVAADAVAGQGSWLGTGDDTLTSPVADLRGHGRVWLQFWHKHAGSTFTPERRGIVQFSADSGRTWADVGVVVGAAGAWYPERIDLPRAAGARGARVRFVTVGFTWWVDAVGFASDSTAAFLAASRAGTLTLSDNPLRGGTVTIGWPASAADARVRIYTYAGVQLLEVAVAAPASEFVWDGAVDGRRVPNGGYLVVVDTGGQRHRGRLFVARR